MFGGAESGQLAATPGQEPEEICRPGRHLNDLYFPQPEDTLGEPAERPRRVALPLRCAWCGRVRVGMVWLPERRGGPALTCSHGICPRCAAEYFRQYLPATKGRPGT